MPKIKTARRDYVCYTCKGNIVRGQRYGIQRVTIGKRGDESIEMRDGNPWIIQNWLSCDAKFCQACVVESEVSR